MENTPTERLYHEIMCPSLIKAGQCDCTPIIVADALSTAPNGTPAFDAVGKPANDASGGTIRVEESSSSTVNGSAPSASAGAAKENKTEMEKPCR